MQEATVEEEEEEGGEESEGGLVGRGALEEEENSCRVTFEADFDGLKLQLRTKESTEMGIVKSKVASKFGKDKARLVLLKPFCLIPTFSWTWMCFWPELPVKLILNCLT